MVREDGRVCEAMVREEAYGLRGVAVDGEVGEDFANDGSEFEAVTGEAGGDGDLWVARVQSDDEVLVGREGVHAGDGAIERTVEVWNEVSQMAAEFGYIGVADGAVDSFGSAARWGAVHAGFHANAIEDALAIDIPDVDGEVGWLEKIGVGDGLEPAHDEAADIERDFEIGEQLGCPGSGCDDEAVRVVGCGFGFDGYAIA